MADMHSMTYNRPTTVTLISPGSVRDTFVERFDRVFIVHVAGHASHLQTFGPERIIPWGRVVQITPCGEEDEAT